jgi:5-oxoprolinase (ATP-hydrolysing)
VRRGLDRLRASGVEAVAICLLHSYRDPRHEEIVAREALAAGFEQVSVSARLSPTIKVVARGDTTVVDAYTTPVVRGYVAAIRARMQTGRLRLMTSAGGLVDAEAASGKDTILSGPAGGVVALAAATVAAGLERAIGFDMGGTSTDVSRYSGGLAYEYETEKAGVRIVAPMLEIETVAAGGGSICDFDGQKLVVGPRSSGADPGPACYGRGGPLSLTDVNLWLGRIAPERFPFPLDDSAVTRRLEELRAKIDAVTGRRLALEEMAEGFVRIANASMAAAIRRVSVAKGYDPRRYALVAFGGAGGQHACALARDLGMRTVLMHPYAGVLSAFGMGAADAREFGVATVLRPLDPPALADLDATFAKLEAELRLKVQAQGIDDERIAPGRRLLELRYRGQSSAIAVAEPQAFSPQPGMAQARHVEEWRLAFEDEHRRLYGHVFTGREVEVAAARVEVTGTIDKAELPVRPERERRAERSATRRLFAAGEWRDAALYDREKLEPGDRLDGPAIVVEATGTTVVEPGWSARLSGRGELMLEEEQRHHVTTGARTAGAGRGDAVRGDRPLSEESSRAERAPGAPDPVELEIFNHHFAAIAEEMGAMLRRTALSVNVKERLDFSCAVFDDSGGLVANAPHMPVHLGAMSETVRCVVRDVPDLGPGDVVITNDPFRGGSHLPDLTVVTPVFVTDRRIPLFFTASRAHHAEIGGIRPGSMPPDSRTLEEEGVVLRPWKVVEGGRPRFDELRRLLGAARYPSRAPDENIADVSAQIAANQLGVRRLLELEANTGRATTLSYMRHIQDAAEAKMRAALRRLGDGGYVFADRLDDGAPITVRIEVHDGSAVLDFTGSAPPLPNNLNANRAIAKAAILYVFRCLIDEDIPLNEGVLAPLEVRIPRSVLDPPSDNDPALCPAVVGGNVETSQRVTDVLLGALGLAAASQGTMNNLTFGDDSFGYYETICGGAGAGPGFAGADAVHTHMTNTRLTDVEVLESRYPVRVVRFEIRRGSGGKGEWRGGDGCRRELEFLAPLQVSILSQRRTTRPFGCAGGEDGAAGRNTLYRARERGGAGIDVGGVATFAVEPGDRLVIETPGGGGWGAASTNRS